MNTFSHPQKEFWSDTSPRVIYPFAILSLIVIVFVILGKAHYLAGIILLSLFALTVLNRTAWGLYFLPIALATPIIIVPGTKLHLAQAVVFFILASCLGYCAFSGEIKGISFPKTYKWVLVLFFSASLLSLLNAPHPITGLVLIVKLALVFIVVFGLVYDYVIDGKTLKRMMLMVVVSGLVAAVYGISQYYLSTGTISFNQGPRIFGRAGGGYGTFIGIAILISISSLLTSRNFSRIMLYLSFLPPLVIALLLSRTRAWILGTALAVLLVFSLWTYKRLGRKCIIILLVIVLLAPFFQSSMKATFLESFSFLFIKQRAMAPKIQMMQNIGEVYDLSLIARYRIWDFAFDTFKKNPLTGIGVGNFRIKNAYRPSLSQGRGEGGWSDNHYINILAETGIPGAIAWIYLAYLLISCCLKIVKSANSEYLTFSFGLVGALIVFAVGGLFWNLTSGLIDSAIFVLIISLIFSTKKIIDQNELQLLKRIS